MSEDPESALQRRTRLGSVALALGSLLIIGAAAVFVWSGVTTASARFAATTSNDSSLISAASVDLVVESGAEAASTGLLLDAGGLYPGLVVERCIGVTYLGTPTDVPVRLIGRAGGGNGLEEFIATVIETGTGSDPECGDFAPTETLFDDSLLEFWNRHGSFETGLHLIDDADNGEETWLRISVEVADDNRAQDLTTAFWLVLEARP